jgi:S-disulfanyl-L-cysteine oxidoreductase SoxD
MMMRMRVATMVMTVSMSGLLLSQAACGDRASSAGTPTTFASYDAGAVPGGPGAARRYSIGSAASDSLVSRMNHDIGMDGTELPAGSGSVAEGAALYAAQCANCHGRNGEGMAAAAATPAFPALIGRDPAGESFPFANNAKAVHTIGNYWPYATTLFDYIKRAMPLLAPGSLSDPQVYALTAYLLAANDVIEDSVSLDAARLRAVRMPYRDRFVADDRKPAPTTP